MKKSLKLKFAKIAAPGQEEVLLALLSSSEDSDQEDVVPDDLCALYERYKVSDAIGKVIFISLIDHNKYSGKQIMSIFKCNNWAWRKGVTLSKEPKFKLPQKVPFKRNRFNVTKCEHFLEYIFANGFLQDTAFVGHLVSSSRSSDTPVVSNGFRVYFHGRS